MEHLVFLTIHLIMNCNLELMSGELMGRNFFELNLREGSLYIFLIAFYVDGDDFYCTE